MAIKQLQTKSYTLNIGANQKNLQDTNTGVKDLTKNVKNADKVKGLAL